MSEKKPGRVREFLRESMKELLERSVWPSRDEVMNMTVVVIVSLIFVSVALAGVDYVISFIVRNMLTGTLATTVFGSRFGIVLLVIAGAVVLAYFGLRYLRRKR